MIGKQLFYSLNIMKKSGRKVKPTTLKNDYLLPVSGYEREFEDQRKGFRRHIQGSNCYSYAMDHFETNRKRPNKTVPGDLYHMTTSNKHPFTDWQSCSNAEKRIVDDGKLLKKKYGLGKSVVRKMKGVLESQEKKKCDLYYRKIALVIETDAERDGIPTDFHFYAQNKIPLYQFYNIKRYYYPEKYGYVNPYISINVNAFVSTLKLKRLRKNAEMSKKEQYDRIINNRALVNMRLHINCIPEYMLDFIIDPFWLLDVAPGMRTLKNCKDKFCKIYEKIKMEKNQKKMMKVLLHAMRDATQILKKKKNIPNRNRVIGLWSHKLGHATPPINTDGDGKLIFCPSKANRNHGGYDYDKTCCYYQILTGWGTTD